MTQLKRMFGSGVEAASYILGGGVLLLALALATFSIAPIEVGAWLRDVLGLAFLACLGTLVFGAIYCWVRMGRLVGVRGGNPARAGFWFEAGMQAANGVATLALTFTLLGISLGIGSLAGQDLTPSTVPTIIRTLTANFSMAFMTTVIGLPTAALLRALLQISFADAAPQRLSTSADG
jgi:hypothetical protein